MRSSSSVFLYTVLCLFISRIQICLSNPSPINFTVCAYQKVKFTLETNWSDTELYTLQRNYRAITDDITYAILCGTPDRLYQDTHYNIDIQSLGNLDLTFNNGTTKPLLSNDGRMNDTVNIVIEYYCDSVSTCEQIRDMNWTSELTRFDYWNGSFVYYANFSGYYNYFVTCNNTLDYCFKAACSLSCGNCTEFPTTIPTKYPSFNPTIYPSSNPTQNPSVTPTSFPSKNPTMYPSVNPSAYPTNFPSNNPSMYPTINPTSVSDNPSNTPTHVPSNNPTSDPTKNPSNNPTMTPSNNPTNVPSLNPSHNPSKTPSNTPSNNPTMTPTNNPTLTPTTSENNPNNRSNSRNSNKNRDSTIILAILLPIMAIIIIICIGSFVYDKLKHGKRYSQNVKQKSHDVEIIETIHEKTNETGNTKTGE